MSVSAAILTHAPVAFLPLKPPLNSNRLKHKKQNKKRRKTACLGGFSKKGGPSDRIRTCGILLPNLSGTLFLLVYSGFQPFPICFTYSLTLLSPLFPGVPEPSVVIYVVKNASRSVFGEDSPMPEGKRFAFQIVCIVTLSRRLCKRFLQGWQLSSCGTIDRE